MIVTPMGAPRHYTLSYSQFVDRMNNDPSFYGWLLQLHQDIVSLLQVHTTLVPSSARCWLS